MIKFNIIPDSEEDRNVVKEIQEKAKNLGATLSNPSGFTRDEATLASTRYLGLISEYLLKLYLEKMLYPIATVRNEEFTNYENHVDLLIESGSSTLSVEVRGSFPYSPIDKVICELFDVIGSYSTVYKSAESLKDIHLRTLINQSVRDFNPTRPHSVIFAGGAERDLFNKIGYVQNFKQRGAQYIAIKPIAKARDVKEIIEIIKKSI